MKVTLKELVEAFLCDELLIMEISWVPGSFLLSLSFLLMKMHFAQYESRGYHPVISTFERVKADLWGGSESFLNYH